MTTFRSAPPGTPSGGSIAAIHWQRVRIVSRLTLAVTLVTVIGLVACDDLTHRDQQAASSPRKGPTMSPRRDNSPVADPAGNDSPDDPTISLTMQTTYDGTMGTSNTNVNYPYLTAVRVVARGVLSRTPNYPQIGDAMQRGPSQLANFGWYAPSGYSGTKILGSGYTAVDTASGYYFIQGALSGPARAGYPTRRYDGARFNGVYIWCGQDNTINPCDTWQGSTSVEFIRLQSTLAVAVDSSSVVPGSAVEFTWGASPAYVEGQQMPVVVDSTRWIPDPDSLGGEPTEQPSSGANACDYTILQGHCKRRIVGSGTFVAKVYVNGKRFAGSMHVQVPQLKLTAVSSAGAVDRSVTFTPSWTDGATVNSPTWQWVADSGAGQTGQCSAGVKPCVRSVHESGRMTVTTTRGGVTRTARVRVTVVPCLTGDSLILNDADVRKALFDAYRASNPDSAESKWREQAGYFIRNPDGSIQAIPLDLASSDNCGFSGTFPVRGDIVGFYHTHIGNPGIWLHCAPGDSTQYLPYRQGGGSNIDWIRLDLYFNKARRDANLPAVPMYIIDGQNWYRMAPDVPWQEGPNHLEYYPICR